MTSPIDLAFARSYLKADGDDDDLITQNLASARSMCEGYCNRKFYDTQDLSDADFTQALVDRAAILTSLQSAINAVPNDSAMRATLRLIDNRYSSQLAEIKGRVNGIVIDDAINAAILLTLGHLYRNREDNLSTGNNVIQLPVGAQRILQSKLWIGDLVDPDSCDTTSYSGS